jgi:hypothetical protein
MLWRCVFDFTRPKLLRGFIDAAEAGKAHIPRSSRFRLDQIVKAHEMTESNKAGGKINVVA